MIVLCKQISMHKQIRRYLQILLIIFDFLFLNISYFVLLYLFDGDLNLFFFSPYLVYLFWLNGFWLASSYIFGVYGESLIMNFEPFIKRTVQVFFLWVIFVFFYLFITREENFSRLFILLTILCFAFILFLNRFLYFGIKHFLRIQSHLVNKVIILGLNDAAKKLAKYFEEEGINTRFLGFIEDGKNVSELTNYPILAELKNAIQVAKELDVQEIFSTIGPEQNRYIYTMMNEAEKKCMRFKVVPDFSIYFRKPVLIDFIRDMPVLSLREDPMEDIGNRVKKRALDLVVSFLVVIFILSWLIPLLALLIKIESRGPVFFVQSRTGRNDKPFSCLKFRSMRMNKDLEAKQATKNDSRVTRLGAFMRKTSLDEFPQFINVLKGDMSLVGPRPHMISHTIDFSKKVNHYMARQFLKPGITGWAQINSFRGEITHPDQLKMRVASDLWYLENWNIWLDLRIIFLTIYQVFIGDKNAY